MGPLQQQRLLRFDRLRRVVQILGTVAANGYLIALSTKQAYAGSAKCTCLPILNCHSCPTAVVSCPLGTLQHYATIHQWPLFLIGQLGLVGLTVGSMACGWLCPFGLLQDLLYRIKSTKLRVPRELTPLRYLVLVLLVLLVPYVTHQNWFSMLCPMGTLSAALPWIALDPIDPLTAQPLIASSALGGLFTLKIAILLAVLALFVLSSRPFCRVLCPLGLVLSWGNKISLLRLSVDKGCEKCDRCLYLCPMDIRVYEEPNASDCIRCLKCTVCPHVRLTTCLPGARPDVACGGWSPEQSTGQGPERSMR